jgi:hypothetical protein
VLLHELVAGGVAQPRLEGALEAGSDAGDLDRVVDDVVRLGMPDADEGDGHASIIAQRAR